MTPVSLKFVHLFSRIFLVRVLFKGDLPWVSLVPLFGPKSSLFTYSVILSINSIVLHQKLQLLEVFFTCYMGKG
uniref:Uncharacterized protein n=1 Tax=Rhizophora mucronata TaxID=61149 RepID=A0A2P2J102_RHIMU